jgi:hypothetical protein
MKSSAFYTVLGLGVIVVACVIWWGVSHQKYSQNTHTASSTSATTTDTPGSPNLTGLSIYTNGDYGFSIFYPGAYAVQHSFDSTYHLPNTWRVNALPNATGTPLFQITGYSTKSDTSYPKYFEAEVRIGASADPKEVTACIKASGSEVAKPNETINGTVWRVFSLQDAGMMQYAQGTSYRTVHEGTCIALEQVESGSSYVGTPSRQDIPEATLTQHYADLTNIVQSFSFAHP